MTLSCFGCGNKNGRHFTHFKSKNSYSLGDGGLAFPDYVMKHRRQLRNSSQNKFIELLPNTETSKNSYFCRTVKDWNALPSEIVIIKSVDCFKKVLFEYISQ